MAPEAWLLLVQVLTALAAGCAIIFILGLIWAVRRRIRRRRGWGEIADDITAENRRALFHHYKLSDRTLAVIGDAEHMTSLELREAINDCDQCIDIEYPETTDGVEQAFVIIDIAKTELTKRAAA